MQKNNIKIKIHLIPGAKENKIVGNYGDRLKIRIKQRPIEGQANKALIDFLSKKLKTPKSNIEIISGHKSKEKIVKIYNISKDNIVVL